MNVQVESLPYEKVLKQYDRPTTFFYLDPPYYQRFLYKFNIEDEQFEVMATRLKELTGKFILSLNDHPDVRRIFKEFEFRTTDLAYSAQKAKGNRYPELLIMNYSPPVK